MDRGPGGRWRGAMARCLRIDRGGIAYHVFNRRVVVNRPESEAELEAVRPSVNRGAPYGEPSWQRRTAKRLKLESSLRPPWRP